ncbi:MAG: hypothetical protein GHHEDOFH_00310 [Pseudorhodoplanes sp.]|nr:hypothetical protein [Pseudorhodoplanes sp.]
MNWGRFAPAAGWSGGVGAVETDPALLRQFADRVRSRLVRCHEIECVRHRISPGILAAAELRAAEIGTGADQVLIAEGHITEEAYAVDLARWLGLSFEPLDGLGRSQVPIDDVDLMQAVAARTLPLIVDGRLVLTVVLRADAARHLVTFLSAHPQLAPQVRITTMERLQRFVFHHAADVIEYRAAHALKAEFPAYSAGTRGGGRLAALTAAAAVLGAALWFNARAVITAVDIALALIFLGWTGLRLLGALTTGLMWRRRAHLSDIELPAYSIIVALYREAAAVPQLLQALRRLDYPPEKLDIKLVLEPDDQETLLAISKCGLNYPLEIIFAPTAAPRTKPKALNAALPFARGSLIAVYDAEDRPERDQLRSAAEAFMTHDWRLACVQARLTIDNTADSWLTRMFTAEYAGLFDVFLPGLALWQLPLPLGGSSNHFRAEALRRAGAWDPHNVTEDADLGMRLARMGYRTAMISSSTYEEAPARFGPWLRQRTRWFKGWMQTWLVHMRHPVRLVRELGFPGFAVFQLVVGGTVLASLVHLIFAAALAWELSAGAGLLRDKAVTDLVITGLHGTTLITGYAISGVLAMIGLARRRLLRFGWALALMPLYWLLLSLAAWRALFQFVVAPYRWEKTEHGRAVTSRLGGYGKRSGATDTFAGRRRRPRADA